MEDDDSDYTQALIKLNDLLSWIKEDGIMTKEEVLKEVENVFEEVVLDD